MYTLRSGPAALVRKARRAIRGLLLIPLAVFASAVTWGADGPPLEKEGVAKPFRAVIISAALREVIREIHVEEGDRVTEGQVLVSLQSEKQQLMVERYEQLITKAQFDFSAAQRLFQQNVSSKDDALAKEVELKRLQADHRIAKADLAEREIRSPLTGVVVRKFKETGESVSENDPMMQVIETDRLLLLFYLEAPLLASIKPEQEMTVRFPELTPSTERKAKVYFIDPEIDSRSGLFRVRLLLENADQMIKPGLRVRALFPPAPANAP